jgi:thiol:disulfide interchange protein/DsbC/DsbD-like thiol-disulfide interchange protein
MMRGLAGLAAFVLALVLGVGLGAHPAQAAPVDTGHLEAELVPDARGIAPGETIHVALRQKIQNHWHTYWRNAGDSGEATRITWTLPPGWSAGEIVWPAPRRLPVGPLVNYGYEGEVLLPVPITAPADARAGQRVVLKAAADFLVCSEICVPERAELALELAVTAGPAQADPKWGRAIRQTLAQAPKPAGLSAAFMRQGAAVKLAIAGPLLRSADVSDAYFFPFAGGVIDHARPQPIERGPEGLTLTLTPGFAFQQDGGPKALAGVLSLGATAYEVNAEHGPPPAGASGLGPPLVRAAGDAQGFTLPAAAALALLGGLLLNLMPCVFPILAMKAASLAGRADRRREAQVQGLAFGAGVLATFLVLASLLVALKAAGAQVGWGFQLQSPQVVAALALLMLAVALNLSGLYEVVSPLQGAGSGLAARGGLTGAFFTGVLAVLVAAPCTAPFMGPAVGWALTQPAATALVVFAGLGIGFALPFVAVAFAPRVLSRLPKPGPWMAVFKKALAFPMYGAAAWLLWVLTQQAEAAFLAQVLTGAVLLALAAWIAGLAQRGAQAGRRRAALAVAAGLAALALAAAVWQGRAALAAEPYSPQRLAALRAEGRPVFVNYTAAWCVSCQVNDRVALASPKVAQAFKRNGVTYLKADWTRRDAVIAGELASFGRAGVPLYLVYGARGKPDILPAILTEGLVIRALDGAGRPG